MKTITLFLLGGYICLQLMACNNQSTPNFTITGTIEGLGDAGLVYWYKDENNNWHSDSIRSTGNTFSHSMYIEEPEVLSFDPNIKRLTKWVTERSYVPSEASSLIFLAIPGTKVQVAGSLSDFVDAYPYGEPENEQLAELHRKIFPLINASANAILEKAHLEEGDPKADELSHKVQSLEQQIIDIKKDFIRQHPEALISVFYLADLMMRGDIPDDEGIELAELLDEELSYFSYYHNVKNRVNGIKSTQRGQPVPAIRATNVLTNTPFNLEEARGKIVLIDFWGTWCAPCIAEMPILHSYSTTYPDQLLIVGVNNGDTIERVKAFTSENGYTWPQVMDEQAEETLSETFNVQGFPTKYIIDQNGLILYKYRGETSEVFTRLDSLLSIPGN